MLFDKYVANWTQVGGEDAGFRRLLADGANYFCSDDHEFWNNAPNFGGVGLLNTLPASNASGGSQRQAASFGRFNHPRPYCSSRFLRSLSVSQTPASTATRRAYGF